MEVDARLKMEAVAGRDREVDAEAEAAVAARGTRRARWAGGTSTASLSIA